MDETADSTNETTGRIAAVRNRLQKRWRGWSVRARRTPSRALQTDHAAELLHAQIADLHDEQAQLRAAYREVTALHREQQRELARMRVSERLFEVSNAEQDRHVGSLLRILMDALDAGGAALWLRESDSDQWTLAAREGRVSARLDDHRIPNVAALPLSELRLECETRLRACAPQPTPLRPKARPLVPDTLFGTIAGANGSDQESRDFSNGEGRTEAEKTEAEMLASAMQIGNSREVRRNSEGRRAGGHVPETSVVVVLLRQPGGDAGAANGLLGAVGLCDCRGVGGFTAEQCERLSALAAPFAAGVKTLRTRQHDAANVMETALLYRIRGLAFTASGDDLYRTLVGQIRAAVPCENCTLFLLDEARRSLHIRATEGRAVNLLDHVRFTHGTGISGWVAGREEPLIVHDLTRATDLLHIEMIPPRIRSFVALPLRVGGEVVGVLNVSHSQANHFTPADLRLLQRLAEEAARVLHHVAPGSTPYTDAETGFTQAVVPSIRSGTRSFTF